MYLMDVNVLVYAHRTDAANHSTYRQWLESVVNGPASFGYSEVVCGKVGIKVISLNLKLIF